MKIRTVKGLDDALTEIQSGSVSARAKTFSRMKLELLESYDRDLAPHLPALAHDFESGLRRILDDSRLMIHSITSRVKSRESLAKKLARPDREYRDVLDVTDLIAFRIITYSEDLIDEVARLIESHYDVDFANSVNKLHQDDSSKFGYRSLHYVCRSSQVGGKFRFEIQIRTILQHTWAEIEHDIGYKAGEQLPREFRRRFSQIAGLLEIADREFASVRIDLKRYETKLRTADFEGERIELNQLSLKSILEKDEIRKLDEDVASYLGVKKDETPFYPGYLVRALKAAGLNFVGDVLAKASTTHLERFLPAYFEFARTHWKLDTIPRIQQGYGLLFLAHLEALNQEALQINKVKRLTRFFEEIDFSEEPESAKAAAQALVAATYARAT